MDTTLTYFQACFANTEGWLIVAVGHEPHLNDNGKYGHKRRNEYPLRWPAQAADVVAAIAKQAPTADVYACPYLMRDRRRTQGNSVSRVLVHADVDGELNLDAVVALGGFAIGSGTPGHAHAYIPLAYPITRAQHEVLCRALARHLGGDTKYSDNDLLRPPGTLNHKSTLAGNDPAAVEWLLPCPAERTDPQVLAAALGADITHAEEQVNSAADAADYTLEPIDLDTYPTVRDTLATNSGDRSADTMRVARACFDAGLTLPQTRWAVRTRGDLAARLDEFATRRQPVDDLQKCWSTIADTEPQALVAASSSVPIGPKLSVGTRTISVIPTPKRWHATDLRPAAQPRWLAKHRIPRAAVSLIIGEEGIGKSLLWVWLAAAITTGTELPGFGIPARDPGHVIIAAITEDDWSTIVRPRLQVARADLSMIDVICAEQDGSGAPVYPRDLNIIATAPKPDLVIVDAWLDTVPPDLQVRDPQQARQALHKWKDLATVTDAAVALICHTNRVATANARDRYGATAALRQKARMSLYCQTDDDNRLIVGPEKANGTTTVAAALFTIEPVPLFQPTADDDGTVPRLVYIGESDQTARQHLAESFAAEHGATDDVVAWLAEALAAGPMWSDTIHRQREACAITERKLRTAKQRLHVETTRLDGTGPWFMRLPVHADRSPDRPPPPRCRPDVAVSPEATSEHLNLYLRLSDVASTSQDSHNNIRDTREEKRHLNLNLRVPDFEPPIGLGRCPDCGYHIATQGHRDNCPANDDQNDTT